jgi:hypothetical protein
MSYIENQFGLGKSCQIASYLDRAVVTRSERGVIFKSIQRLCCFSKLGLSVTFRQQDYVAGIYERPPRNIYDQKYLGLKLKAL